MKIPSQQVLRAFRRRLTNLSSRNRSLLLTSLPAGQFLDLHEADFLLNKSSFSLIADLIGRKPSVSICEVLDPRLERTNEVSRKLRRIDRTARFIEEERGTEDLYVGWPFVKGKLLDDTVIHGPLLFFPVQIEQQGKYWKLIRRGEELAFLNPTLALAYGQFNQVKVPEEVVEKTLDDFDRDPLVFRTQLYEWLKTTPLEINFNQDLLTTDSLHVFNRQSTSDLAQLERTGELKLYPEAVLGIFPQAGSFLVPDYDTLLALPAPEEGALPAPEVPPTPFALHPLPEKLIHTPLPMDASQEAAVRAVKSGESLVVQGPPGTGKSQLIANLMADAAASGKRVLLVCQKRAALDVVRERLQQVGMAPFMALIHDFQDDRRNLYAQIASQIDQLDAYRQQNNSLNAVLLERDFELESRRIDETVADLEAFKEALFDADTCGVSAKELYLTSRFSHDALPLDDSYPQFKMADVDNFSRRLANYSAYQQRLGTTSWWAERVRFTSFTSADENRMDQTIQHWDQVRQATTAQMQPVLGYALSLAQLAVWQAHDWDVTALLNLLDNPQVKAHWAAIRHLLATPTHPAVMADEVTFQKLIQTWEEALLSPGPEVLLATPDLRSFKGILTEAVSARASWVSWNWWQLTSKHKDLLQQVITANALTLTEADLQLLQQKVDKRIRLEATRYEAATLLTNLALPDAPASLRFLQQVQHLTERLRDLEPLRQLPEIVWQQPDSFIDTVRTVLGIATVVAQQQAVAQPYLTTAQLQQLWQQPDLIPQARRTLRQDFDLMVEADRLWEGFSEQEQLILEQLKPIPAENWATLVQDSFRVAWLNHIEGLYPELRSVSSLKMAQWEQALQESVQRKQLLSRDILLMKLREQTYRNLTFNRLNNVVSYRDLLHQTTKKRNIWPVRKLMETYADEVFKLVPCWLASPESVSAMFPLQEGLFDLVIFDEASQCFAEQGIPAMVRGKQVVVTGDSQQLRPSDLYQARLDDSTTDEDTPAALEVESLLALAAQQLPQVALTEHYRSRSLDLISFSNEHFYQNKLSLLPNFEEANQHEPAIRYLNVKGTWHQHTNRAEAEAVIDLVEQLQTELPGRTIGIVTFNYQQQQLIQDMLTPLTPNENSQEVPVVDKAVREALFVKNIENVQGDERDVIIFSIGYAPDERGRLSMQFGSLNTRGGENRLNVAVTRARERVYVVTSLWPEQLQVADVANEGPRLLKAYLTYALQVAQQQFRPTPAVVGGALPGLLLKHKLTQLHPNWVPELPFADLTVKEGEAYKAVVLTDDDAFYAQTTKQAHAYLPLALQARQWTYTRMWSREYWRKQSNDGRES